MAVASLRRRSFFSVLVSGRYLLRSLKAWGAVFLSRTCWNWEIAGGTLRRRLRIFFWRWRRMYSGHFTMRDRLRLGWMSWPIPKLRDRFSMRGFLYRVSDRKMQRQRRTEGGRTDLGGLLRTSLSLREGGRGGLLAGLGRLSLRRGHQ